MTTTRSRRPQSNLASAAKEQFRADVLRGLLAAEKELPCKYLYDEAGSRLFEQITSLAEYYLTRTELAIMRCYANEMAKLLGRRCLLIEYGSGSSHKTRLLLDHLSEPAGYVPVDIAREFLLRSAHALTTEYPELEVIPVHADFTQRLNFPALRVNADKRVIYFPGSTIGNLTPDEAAALLRNAKEVFGLSGGILLGIDLQKDTQIIQAAYNDRLGVTAAFNRNLLVRIRRELNAKIEVDQFEHRAFYNTTAGRIEMHLVSQCNQRIRVSEVDVPVVSGESIRTEYSYKYSLPGLHELAAAAGLVVAQVWTDRERFFSVSYLTSPTVLCNK